MKKLFIFIFALTLLFMFTLSAQAAELSPALSVLRSERHMIKTCIGENAVSFSASDFEKFIGASVSEVTIVSAPNEELGVMMFDGAEIGQGKKLQCSEISKLSFVPKTSEGFSDAEVVFSVDGVEYTCRICHSASLNFAPKAVGAAVSCMAGVSVHSRLMSEDPEGDEVSYKVASYPKYGSVSLNKNTGEFVYTADNGFIGHDSFTYTVIDSFGNESKPARIKVKTAMNKTGTVYDDMKDSSAHIAAVKMAESDVIVGEKIGDKQYFYPEKAVSRVDFLIMAMDAMNIAPVSAVDTGFADDDMLTPYEKTYVAAASELGIVKGFNKDGELFFDPDGIPTLGEAAATVLGIASHLGFEITESVSASCYSDGYMSPEGMMTMKSLGIIPEGDSDGEINREMTASLLWSLMNLK